MEDWKIRDMPSLMRQFGVCTQAIADQLVTHGANYIFKLGDAA